MSNWWKTKNPVVVNFIKKCVRDYTFDFSLLSHKVIPITNFFTDFILVSLSYKYYQNNPPPLC